MTTPLERLPPKDIPEILSVSEERVQGTLLKINPTDAAGPDMIPKWLLKEYADILALPITEILNASYRQQRLPSVWKMADVSRVPKKKLVLDLKKDLRPISLTPCISKVAEGFVVDDYLKPAVLNVIDSSQYGEVPKSSTTLALISMLHTWSLETNGNGATVRTLLFDYRKAFDLIDHSILVNKLRNLTVPSSIINWIIDFLSNRSQRIKLAKGCYFRVGPSPLRGTAEYQIRSMAFCINDKW